MARPGRPTVNRTKGKPSYITVETDVDLSSATGVDSVKDENTDPWLASPFKLLSARILVVKLKGRSRETKDLGGGDTGQLTVVLTNPPDTTQVPVNYVDDPNP